MTTDNDVKTVRIPDSDLDRIGDMYRAECEKSGTHAMVRDGWLVHFEQFLHERLESEAIEIYCSRRAA